MCPGQGRLGLDHVLLGVTRGVSVQATWLRVAPQFFTRVHFSNLAEDAQKSRRRRSGCYTVEMFRDSLQLLALNLLPQHAISRVVGAFARSPMSRAAIPFFAKRFCIDLTQAEKPVERYANLTEFFTRRLKPGLRPIDPDPKSIVSPCDGRVSAAGRIEHDMLWQVKGMRYSLADLLGADTDKVRKFEDGQFVTIYLSPQDYHRIHMPVGGRLVEVAYFPGSLFPVNPFAVRTVTRLFARNERLITYAETQAGLVAIIKVGAMLVGSIRVVYGDYATNTQRARPVRESIPGSPRLAKGDELGRFEFGSTVILLFEPNKAELMDFENHAPLHMGQAIGRLSQATPSRRRGSGRSR